MTGTSPAARHASENADARQRTNPLPDRQCWDADEAVVVGHARAELRNSYVYSLMGRSNPWSILDLLHRAGSMRWRREDSEGFFAGERGCNRRMGTRPYEGNLAGASPMGALLSHHRRNRRALLHPA